MAKGMFGPARRGINQVRKALRQDTMGDYNATQSQLDAIFKNLTSAGAGLGAKLTSTQSRELAAMQRLADRGNQRGIESLRSARSGIRNRYGAALGQIAQTDLGPARAARAATGVGAAGQLGAGALLAKGGAQALKTQRASASEAASAAEYATAVALKSRNQQDASQVADMQFQLQQQKLQFQLAEKSAQADFERQKELMLFEQDQAEKEKRPSYAQVLSTAPQIASVMSTSNQVPVFGPDDYNNYGTAQQQLKPDAQPDSYRAATAQELISSYAAQAGLSPDNPDDVAQLQLVSTVARNMAINKMSATEATQAAVATLYGDSPGFSKVVATANESIVTGVQAANTSTIVDLLKRRAGGEQLPESEWNKLIEALNSRGLFDEAAELQFSFKYQIDSPEKGMAAINSALAALSGK